LNNEGNSPVRRVQRSVRLSQVLVGETANLRNLIRTGEWARSHRRRAEDQRNMSNSISTLLTRNLQEVHKPMNHRLTDGHHTHH
jgi:hypothetical protein